MDSRQFSAQGSITIRRLRQGDSLFITLANISGHPLYQHIDVDNGNTVAPDWSDNDNDALRPVIRPQVSSTNGFPVVITSPEWRYNGVRLSFTTPASSGQWVPEDGDSPRFAFRASDNAIKPIANLAAPNATSSGSLEFSCVAQVSGGSYSISKSVDVVIARGGSSGYHGFLTASSLTLDAENPSSSLTASLFCGGSEVPDFFVKWYRDRSPLRTWDGKKQVNVSRQQVDSTQLFIAQFYLSESDAKPVAFAGVTVVDTADEFDVNLDIISDNKDIDDKNTSVTVKAYLVNSKGEIKSDNIKWLLDVVDRETFKSLKSSNTDTIEVTTAETDRTRIVDGVPKMVCSDVDVLAEAHWGINFSLSPDQITLESQPYWRDENYVKSFAAQMQQ